MNGLGRWRESAGVIVEDQAGPQADRPSRALYAGHEKAMGGRLRVRVDRQNRDRPEPPPESAEDLRERVGPVDHDEAAAGAQQSKARDNPTL